MKPKTFQNLKYRKQTKIKQESRQHIKYLYVYNSQQFSTHIRIYFILLACLCFFNCIWSQLSGQCKQEKDTNWIEFNTNMQIACKVMGDWQKMNIGKNVVPSRCCGCESLIVIIKHTMRKNIYFVEKRRNLQFYFKSALN